MMKNLQKIFLDRIEKLPSHAGKNKDYHMRKTRNRLHNEFDAIWIMYENKKTTYNEWEKSLDKWIYSELI